jgi:hypothetical protein
MKAVVINPLGTTLDQREASNQFPLTGSSQLVDCAGDEDDA